MGSSAVAGTGAVSAEMLGITHPYTGLLYEQDGEGHVIVSDGERSGLFHIDGRYISGEVKEADPQLCGWVGGPQINKHEFKD